MKSRILVLLAAFSAGCTPRPATVDEPTPPRQGPDEVARVIADADRTLLASYSMDYLAPRGGRRDVLHEKALALFQRACRLGDRRSCWRAAVLMRSGRVADRDEVVGATGNNCLAGDAMSCRALQSVRLDDNKLTRELCTKGVGVACSSVGDWQETNIGKRAWYQRGCDAGYSEACSALRTLMREDSRDEQRRIEQRVLVQAAHECDLGWARSCVTLDERNANGTEPSRTGPTAEQGCRDGLLGECRLTHRGDARAQAAGLRARCLESFIGPCGDLAKLHAPDGPLPDPDSLRDAYEHGCQLGSRDDCLELARRYVVGDLLEPVPGRGRDLFEFVCVEDVFRDRRQNECAIVRAALPSAQ